MHTSIAKLLGVSRTTLYKYVPELAAGRDSLDNIDPRRLRRSITSNP
ncbi:helix-turn-helix domain-containing protein [Streptomyces sp. NPDC059909]